MFCIFLRKKWKTLCMHSFLSPALVTKYFCYANSISDVNIAYVRKPVHINVTVFTRTLFSKEHRHRVIFQDTELLQQRQ